MSSRTHTALRVRDLSVGYTSSVGDTTQIVASVDLDLQPGRILGLAGESGSGKSTAALAALGYRRPGTVILGGTSVLAGGVDILAVSEAERRRLWGSRVAYVPQSAAASLNPGTTIGKQLAQPLLAHTKLRGRAVRARQVELMEQMGFPEPESVLSRYPFQFSGGQQQRISLALALACRPEVIILDEPTTGLDVTTQARTTALLRSLVSDLGISALYISHDLSLLAQVADDVAVMYAGEVVERSPMRAFVQRPKHPYSRALYDITAGAEQGHLVGGIPGSTPGAVVLDGCAFASRCEFAQAGCRSSHPALQTIDAAHEARCHLVFELTERPALVRDARDVRAAVPGPSLLEMDDIVYTYKGTSSPVLKGVGLRVGAGETVGLVGESGSGKSTLLRVAAGLARPDAGEVRLDGERMNAEVRHRTSRQRRDVQLIFQNPDSSLNPRHSVGDILRRPLRLFRDDVPRRAEDGAVNELLDAVRLPSSYGSRFPHELSGGQRQRIAIARAFAAKPRLLLCDEITSALDVSVQATVLELLAGLARRTDVGIVFVGHDLAVVKAVADRTHVMRQGEVVEHGETTRLFASPTHPYTRELVNAAPELVAT